MSFSQVSCQDVELQVSCFIERQLLEIYLAKKKDCSIHIQIWRKLLIQYIGMLYGGLLGLRVDVKKTKIMISSKNTGYLTEKGQFPCVVCRKDVGSNSILCQFYRCQVVRKGYSAPISKPSPYLYLTLVSKNMSYHPPPSISTTPIHICHSHPKPYLPLHSTPSPIPPISPTHIAHS